MRRKDKQITDNNFIYDIIKRAKVCRLALSINDNPYVIPLNFGFKNNHLYFHSAKKGKKIDILRKNKNVCFEIDLNYDLIEAENPCDYGARYYSVIGFGKAELIYKTEQKRAAMNIIMEHYTGNSNYTYDEAMLKRIVVIKVKIIELSGKESEY
jgi:hypothetical protein